MGRVVAAGVLVALCNAACTHALLASPFSRGTPLTMGRPAATLGCGGSCRELRMSDEAGADGSFGRRELLNLVAKAGGYIGAGATLRLPLVTGPVAPFYGMVGKRCVVTGGNVGLGFETAVGLLKRGADVVIACRNAEKAQRAVEGITAEAAKGGHKAGVPVGTVTAAQLDLASLASVRTFAKTLSGPVDVLVNNAGVMAVPTLERTADGFEYQFGVNHLGHFLLTGLLLDRLKQSPDGRVISVSSEAHRIPPATLNPGGDVNFNKQDYAPWTAYMQSKLANVLFIRELDSRLRAAAAGRGTGPAITAMAVHPGACRTDLGRYLFDASSISPVGAVLAAPLLGAAVALTKSPREGSQTQLRCASDPRLGGGVGGGEYYLDTHRGDPSLEARDDAAARWLWSESEKLVGFQYTI